MARVVITGGTGFIGQLLARKILQKGQLLSHAAAVAAAAEVVVPIRVKSCLQM